MMRFIFSIAFTLCCAGLLAQSNQADTIIQSDVPVVAQRDLGLYNTPGTGIRIINKTNENIDSIFIDCKYLGGIARDDSIDRHYNYYFKDASLLFNQSVVQTRSKGCDPVVSSYDDNLLRCLNPNKLEVTKRVYIIKNELEGGFSLLVWSFNLNSD
jgi:hypothetical protein